MRRVVALGSLATLTLALGMGSAATAAAAAAKTSSNDEATKDPVAILADARSATGNSRSVAITGTIVSNGNRTSLNIVSAHGAGGGTVTTNGTTFRLVVNPPKLYLKGDAATWTKVTGNRTAGELFGGRWLQTTTGASNSFASLGRLFDVSQLADQLFPNAAVTSTATTNFRGVRAIPLAVVDSHGSGTIYVEANGKHYILGIVNTGAGSGQLVFSQYGKAKRPATPRHSIDLSQMMPTTATVPTIQQSAWKSPEASAGTTAADSE